MTALQQQGQAAKAATYVLATAGTARKNAALNAIADVLTERQTEWLSANAEDVAAAKEAGMRPAMLDRLTLTPERVAGIVDGVRCYGGNGRLMEELGVAWEKCDRVEALRAAL